MTLSEQKVLWFRCSMTGRLFATAFGRYSPAHRFQFITNLEDGTHAPAVSAPSPVKNMSRGIESFRADDFDFTGWHCPYCGHAKTGSSLFFFVQCSRCKECVCGARVRKINDSLSFACHDKCGNTGEVSGRIASYDGASIDDAQSAQRLKGKQKMLPQTNLPVLPKKR